MVARAFKQMPWFTYEGIFLSIMMSVIFSFVYSHTASRPPTPQMRESSIVALLESKSIFSICKVISGSSGVMLRIGLKEVVLLFEFGEFMDAGCELSLFAFIQRSNYV